MTKDEAQRRVTEGAALLDRVRPGWAGAIDVGELDMEADCGCILGQLEGSYQAAIKKWWPAKTRLLAFAHRRRVADDQEATAVSYGFQTSQHGTPFGSFEHAQLRDAWIEAIADRIVRSESASAADPVVPVGQRITE